jgi:uncharacterized RDD family membrane protein YckC
MATTEPAVPPGAVAPEVKARSAGERRVLTPEGVPLIFQLAERGERAAAVLIDLVVMGLAMLAFFLAIGFGFNWLGVPTLGFGLIILSAFFIRSFYFIYFELRWQGQTPGKRALGIRVMDRKGGYLRPDSVFARNLLREVELFLPLSLMATSGIGGSSGLVSLLSLGWVAIFLLLPFFNKDRLRAGDLVAGTWVIAAPKSLLLGDVAAGATRPKGSAVVLDPEFPFTRGQLEIYGIYELQTLEEVLRQRGPQSRETRREVATRIQRKIGWSDDKATDAERFLKAFYAALRAHLENRLLFGERRENKHAGKNRSKPSPDGSAIQ